MHHCPRKHPKPSEAYECPECGLPDLAAIETDLYPTIFPRRLTKEEEIAMFAAEVYILGHFLPLRSHGYPAKDEKVVDPLFHKVFSWSYLRMGITGYLGSLSFQRRRTFFNRVSWQIRRLPFRHFVRQRFSASPLTLVELVEESIKRWRPLLEESS